MQNKIKIVHLPNRLASFNSDWLRPWVSEWLEFEPWDSNAQYAPGSLFYIKDMHTELHNVDQLLDCGFKIIYDNLWEPLAPPDFPAHIAHNTNWFWYNESLWYRHLSLHEYQPVKHMQYRALMPMRLEKPHRTFLVRELNTVLESMLWSYVAQGRQLPRDQDMSDWNTQRYFNPDWYNQSYCSVVAETLAEPEPRHPVFITEKTYKAIAFQHPFVVFGNPGTLTHLHHNGFATFDNLWDESYDQITDTWARGRAVVNIVKNLTAQLYDSETQQRIQHNHSHFFDQQHIKQRIYSEIIEPIIHYAET